MGQIGEEQRTVRVPEEEPMRWPQKEEQEQEKVVQPEKELVPAGE